MVSKVFHTHVLILLLASITTVFATPINTSPKHIGRGICAPQRLIQDAACHCYVAYETKLIPRVMSRMCIRGFGKNLHSLGTACRRYSNNKGYLNVPLYLNSFKTCMHSCFNNNHMNVASHQWYSNNRYGRTSNSLFAPTPPFVGGIDTEWNKVNLPGRKKRRGSLTYGKDRGLEVKVPVTKTGNLHISSDLKKNHRVHFKNKNFGIYADSNDNYGVSVQFPFP